MYKQTSEEWAQLVFGKADLGDPRRTRRLTLLANDMASNASSSIVKACDNPAKLKALIALLEMIIYAQKILPTPVFHKPVR